MRISYLITYIDCLGDEAKHFCYDRRDAEKQVQKLKSNGYRIIQVRKHKPYESYGYC